MKFRVGTFNLFQFVEPPYAWYTKKEKFTPRQWAEKTKWIKQQIIKMDCDIIGFQEVFSRDALESLVKELGFAYFATVDRAKLSTNNPQKYVTTTVAIASRFPITQLEDVPIDHPSLIRHRCDEAFAFSRIPIKATVILPDKQELWVYVCHLKSNRLNAFEHTFFARHTLEEKKAIITQVIEGKGSQALKQRLGEASSLFFDSQHSSPQKPILLLCDLNDKEFSITIDALCNPKYHDATSPYDPILYDAYYHHTEPIKNPHPEQREPSRKATSYFQGRGSVLDYVFISREFTVTNYTVLDAHLQTNPDGSLIQSDHAQVVCELRLDGTNR
ncbi:MAG TPA: endonuclease [Campylobacterales bacterium]|nr:endonuclease [Campylobacterales bacterium]